MKHYSCDICGAECKSVVHGACFEIPFQASGKHQRVRFEDVCNDCASRIKEINAEDFALLIKQFVTNMPLPPEPSKEESE